MSDSSSNSSPISARKLRANRRNARKSTGPKTEAGKHNSRLNGMVHGLYLADCFMLPGENKSEFLGFREDFVRDLHPMNSIQLLLVDRIAQASWKLHRLNQLNQAMHEKQLFEYATQQAAELRVAEQQIQQTADDESDVDFSKWYDKYLTNRQIAQCDQATREFDCDDRDVTRAKHRARGLTKMLTRLEDDERVSPVIDAGELQMELLRTPVGSEQIERQSRQEQRLENSIHRNLRELQWLQKMDRERSDEIQPPSPYLTPLSELTRQAKETADAYEKELKADDAEEIVRSEATEGDGDGKSSEGKELGEDQAEETEPDHEEMDLEAAMEVVKRAMGGGFDGGGGDEDRGRR